MRSRVVNYCHKCIGHYVASSIRNFLKYNTYCSLTDKRCKKACEHYKEDKEEMKKIMELYGNNPIVKGINQIDKDIVKDAVRRIAEKKFIIDIIRERQNEINKNNL